eukprot:11449585-Ditylum_brightwellii.AAC.1
MGLTDSQRDLLSREDLVTEEDYVDFKTLNWKLCWWWRVSGSSCNPSYSSHIWNLSYSNSSKGTDHEITSNTMHYQNTLHHFKVSYDAPATQMEEDAPKITILSKTNPPLKWCDQFKFVCPSQLCDKREL